MDYSALFSSLQKQAMQIAFVLPSQSNASFEGQQVTGGYVPSGTAGNYRPGTKVPIALTARLYPRQMPEGLVLPGSNVALQYWEGVLVSPLSYQIEKDLKLKGIINGKSGQFEFLPIKPGAIAHLARPRSFMGQRIAGFFLVD